MNVPTPFSSAENDDGFQLRFTQPGGIDAEVIWAMPGLTSEEKDKSREFIGQLVTLCNRAYAAGFSAGGATALFTPNQVLN